MKKNIRRARRSNACSGNIGISQIRHQTYGQEIFGSKALKPQKADTFRLLHHI